MPSTKFIPVSAAITKADVDRLEITFSDQVGNKQSLTLGPDAMNSLLAVLLSSASQPLHSGQAKVRPVKTAGVRAMRLDGGIYCLEWLVGNNQAIYTAFPPTALPTLRAQLDNLENPQPSQKGH